MANTEHISVCFRCTVGAWSATTLKWNGANSLSQLALVLHSELISSFFRKHLVRFPNSLGCELGERRSYSLWIELPGPIVPKNLIGSGKMGTESESSTQRLGSLIDQTFKTSMVSAAERHFSLPPVCHFFGRPDIRAVYVLNKFHICEKLHFRFLPWFPDRFAFKKI